MEDQRRSDDAIDWGRIDRSVLDAIYRRDYDRAASLIEATSEKVPNTEKHRLLSLTATLHRWKGDLQESIRLMREAQRQSPAWLPHLHELADYLMEAEEWSEADAVLDDLISLCEAKSDYYFLDDARVRKVLCLRKLNRDAEIDFQKSKILRDTQTVIGGKIYGIDDLI